LVATVVAKAAVAPREPGAVTVGVPEKCTVLAEALSVIWTLSSGPGAGRNCDGGPCPPAGSISRLKHAARFSVKVNEAVPLDVPPMGMVPAETTVTDANAAGAAIVATRAESNVAVKATDAPFLRMFKGPDPPKDASITAAVPRSRRLTSLLPARSIR